MKLIQTIYDYDVVMHANFCQNNLSNRGFIAL